VRPAPRREWPTESLARAGHRPTAGRDLGLELAAPAQQRLRGSAVLLDRVQRLDRLPQLGQQLGGGRVVRGRIGGNRLDTARARSAAANTAAGRPDSSARATPNSASRRPCTADAVRRSTLPNLAW